MVAACVRASAARKAKSAAAQHTDASSRPALRMEAIDSAQWCGSNSGVLLRVAVLLSMGPAIRAANRLSNLATWQRSMQRWSQP
jgi:hypothetical protein